MFNIYLSAFYKEHQNVDVLLSLIIIFPLQSLYHWRMARSAEEQGDAQLRHRRVRTSLRNYLTPPLAWAPVKWGQQ